VNSAVTTIVTASCSYQWRYFSQRWQTFTTTSCSGRQKYDIRNVYR